LPALVQADRLAEASALVEAAIGLRLTD
jgi:hypothetical protein